MDGIVIKITTSIARRSAMSQVNIYIFGSWKTFEFITCGSSLYDQLWPRMFDDKVLKSLYWKDDEQMNSWWSFPGTTSSMDTCQMWNLAKRMDLS